MKREQDAFRKKGKQKERKRSWFDDEGYSPSKKLLQQQYKRKQKYRNTEDWDI
jgi:hypothetical protein